MAKVPINVEAARAMLAAAKQYANDRNMPPEEMGTALLLAGFGLMSTMVNDVQLDEVIAFLKNLSSPLRQGQRS